MEDSCADGEDGYIMGQTSRGLYVHRGMDTLKLYVESSNPAQAYYMDEVEIRQVSETPTEPTGGIVSSFEDGTAQGWVTRMGTETVQVSNVDARTGSYSLLTTGRQQTYAGPKLDVTATVQREVAIRLVPG